ncbi:YhcB family protein [Echinimonas agarilytica]|uniref:Z-ring associated protein G n=1 Tax=Echinimonas agarilytica TaxID=1215918 RepID=A0AA41W4B8_9GAMM|nr:DUF1043 family protein [Echinimonas agarilytica]MCM2678627.1 YhcB family protein [Echinimonas agarilytica]
MSWIPFACAFGGLIVGVVIGRLWFGGSVQGSAVDVELQNTRTEFDRYKTEVAEHLKATSELMHSAQHNYEKLSEQLQLTKSLLTDAQPDDAEKPVTTAPKAIGELPPRDYAGSAHGLMKQGESVS